MKGHLVRLHSQIADCPMLFCQAATPTSSTLLRQGMMLLLVSVIVELMNVGSVSYTPLISVRRRNKCISNGTWLPGKGIPAPALKKLKLAQTSENKPSIITVVGGHRGELPRERI